MKGSKTCCLSHTSFTIQNTDMERAEKENTIESLGIIHYLRDKSCNKTIVFASQRQERTQGIKHESNARKDAF